MFKKLSYLFILLVVVSACRNEQVGSDKTVNTSITEKGVEERSEWCSDFDLTSEEAGVFLNKAKEITASEYHNEYDHIGCYVKGTTNYKGEQCNVTIWAGATAELQCGKTEYFLGCTDCEFVGSK